MDGNSAAAPPAASTETAVISKKALKRQRRQELAQTKKVQKKAAEKARKKARKASSVGGGGGADERERESLERAVLPLRPRAEVNKEKRAEFLGRCAGNFSVIIDCAWPEHLVGRPLVSLAQQILFCYGANRHASHPCGLYLTGISPLLREQLHKSSMSNWVGVHVHSEEYLSLPCFTVGDPQTADSSSSSDGSDGSPRPPQRLVYLTSDAEETLDTLLPDTAYIIGGIVDHNRLKGATFNKARAQGVRTAKLPIKEYMSMHSSHVLTVNHVFDLLLRFAANGGDWREAIAQSLPQRKGAKVKGGAEEEAEASSSGVEVDGDGEGHGAWDGGTEDNREEEDDEEDDDDDDDDDEDDEEQEEEKEDKDEDKV